MIFGYSDEHRLLIQSVTDFVQTEINPRLSNASDPSSFNRALWKLCAKQGLLEMMMPTPWSETDDSDLLSQVIALESFGYACEDNALPFALAAQSCTIQGALLAHATTEQKKHYLPRCLNGEWIGAHAMTEPDAGSDSANMQALATKTTEGYLLSGKKIMITLAPIADFVIVFATLNPDAGRWGQTAFLVNSSDPGFEVSKPVNKIGLASTPMGHITLDECEIPESQRLGPEGAGAAIAQHSLELERICILASQVGRMRKQLEQSVAYANSRIQFGQPVSQFQSVSNRLADMRLRAENAQLLLYKTAWKRDQRDNILLESAMLKLLVSEHFLDSSVDSMRIHGGYAYIDDHAAGKDTRDALGGVLYAGTSDIQRNIIAGLLKKE